MTTIHARTWSQWLAGLLLLALAPVFAGCSGGGGATGPNLTGSAATALVSIAVTPSGTAIALGTSQQFTATGTFSNGSTLDLSSQVTWSVTNGTGTASLSPGGLATGTAVGRVTVVATLDGVSGSTALHITAATLSALSVTPAGPSIPKGTEQQFTATGTFSDGTTQDLTSSVTWSAEDGTGSATISNAAGSQGLATGTAAGTAGISCSIALSGTTTRSDTATLTVSPATLSSIAVTPASPAVALGTSQQFTATGTFSDGSTRDLSSQVTWSVTNGTGTATISAGGLASGTGVGQVTVGATLDGVSGSTALQITAATLSALSVTPASASIPKGTEQQFTATGTFSDGTTQDLTSSVLWSTEDGTGSATISNTSGSKGLATATSVGTVAISCTITMSGTAIDGDTATLSVVNTFVYVADGNSSVVRSFTMDTSTGALTALGSTGAGTNPFALALDPTGSSLYVTQLGARKLSAFSIDSTGALTEISGSPYDVGFIPHAIAMDPQGRFVYVPNKSSNTVSAFTRDSATGALTAVAGSPFAAGADPTGAVVDPTGRFLYVSNAGISYGGVRNGNTSLSAYTIDQATGALTAVAGSPFLVGSWYQQGMAATGSFLYVGDSGGVRAFTIDSETGVPTEVSGSPFSVSGNAFSIAVNSAGTRAYVGRGGGVNVLTIDSGTGALTTATSATPSSIFAVALDPTERFLVGSQFSGAVHVFDGTYLQQVAGSPFSGSTTGTWVVVTP